MDYTNLDAVCARSRLIMCPATINDIPEMVALDAECFKDAPVYNGYRDGTTENKDDLRQNARYKAEFTNYYKKIIKYHRAGGWIVNVIVDTHRNDRIVALGYCQIYGGPNGPGIPYCPGW